MAYTYKNKGGNYRQNHGVAGVVYILENPGLRQGIYKIGCSRRSGAVRANKLNDDANTGTPGIYKCVFEHHTKDCGRAEELVHQQLEAVRTGKWGQEFFEVPIEKAIDTIIQVIQKVDREILESIKHQSPIKTETQFRNHYAKRSSTKKDDGITTTVLGIVGFGLLLWIYVGAARLGETLKSGGVSNLLIFFVLIVVVVNVIVWIFKKWGIHHSGEPQQEFSEHTKTLSILDLPSSVILHKEPENQKQRKTCPTAPISEDACTKNTISEIHPYYEYQLINKLSISEADIKYAESKKWPLLLSQIKEGDELWEYHASFTNIGEYGVAIVRDRKIISILLNESYHDFCF